MNTNLARFSGNPVAANCTRLHGHLGTTISSATIIVLAFSAVLRSVLKRSKLCCLLIFVSPEPADTSMLLLIYNLFPAICSIDLHYTNWYFILFFSNYTLKYWNSVLMLRSIWNINSALKKVHFFSYRYLSEAKSD